jgi:NADP-dependent 3-hydroxy acid dehydrogenase YdfG
MMKTDLTSGAKSGFGRAYTELFVDKGWQEMILPKPFTGQWSGRLR